MASRLEIWVLIAWFASPQPSNLSGVSTSQGSGQAQANTGWYMLKLNMECYDYICIIL